MYNNNQIRFSQTPGGKIFLHLPDGKDYKPRRWVADKDGDTLRVIRDPGKHFMRAVQGYGFSYDLIKRTDFKILAVHLPYDTIYTTKEYVLANGKFLNFQKNKLERQIFLPVSEFGLERAIKWENEHHEIMKAKEAERKIEQNVKTQAQQTELFDGISAS